MSDATIDRPALDTANVAALAAELRNCFETGQTVAPLRKRTTSDDVDTAYAIQDTNTSFYEGQGRRLVGRKIGLTSKVAQAQLGVDQPDFGMLFADVAAGEGEEIAVSRLHQPKVEAEIALILGQDPDIEQPTIADVILATAYVVPALEIVGSRVLNWDIRTFDSVADNASSGMFVLGGPARRRPRFARSSNDDATRTCGRNHRPECGFHRQRSRLSWPSPECSGLARGGSGKAWPPTRSRRRSVDRRTWSDGPGHGWRHVRCSTVGTRRSHG